MPPRKLAAALAGLALLGSSCARAQPVGIELELEEVASGIASPVDVAHAGDGSGRLFVAEQEGRIRVLRDGALVGEPFLDLTDRVACCGERGLLGLAFHPRYEENGIFFVHYSDLAGDTAIERYRVSAADPDRADPGSGELVLALDQPFSNHNGGQLAFGPDGMLYIALGDGGSGGDPQGNGQDLGTLLGAILRIDVDRTDPGLAYAVPPDNPFVGTAGARGEIWSWGLRNPWRFSFDRATGEMFIADVGQNMWEEIDHAPPGAGGRNYGWNRMEGDHCFQPPIGCGAPGLEPPILEYSHAEGCAVVGGYRYRGSREPALAGIYLFGDFCSGRIWGATRECGNGWQAAELLDTAIAIKTFGEDEEGEVYVAGGGGNGRVWRIAAGGEAGAPSPGETGDAGSALCLGAGERFEVVARFRTAAGQEGAGVPVDLNADSGLFWFFDEDNLELVVKVLDACAEPFRRFWVFAAGLTDVEVELVVTDLVGGGERVYRNELGTPFQPIQDTDAFAACP